MPQELNSCFYPLNYSHIGFVICCFAQVTESINDVEHLVFWGFHNLLRGSAHDNKPKVLEAETEALTLMTGKSVC